MQFKSEILQLKLS